MVRPHAREQRYFASQFKKVYRRPARDDGDAGSSGRRLAGGESGSDPALPVDPLPAAHAAGPSARSPAPYYDRDAERLYAAVNLSRRAWRTSPRSTCDGRRSRACARSWDRLSTTSPRSRTTRREALFYTADNSVARHLRRRSRDGQVAALIKDARIGDLVVNPADQSLWGVRHYNGFSTSCASRRRTTTWTSS